MRQSLPVLISLTLLLALSSSTCKKPLVCTGNCYDLPITGTATNVLTGLPASHVPFTLYRGNHGSLISVRRKIIDFEADEQGKIVATASIDTSVLKDHYFFYAIVSDNPDWIMPSGDANALFDLAQSPFSNYQPHVYPRANLNIKLRHDSNKDQSVFQVMVYYADNGYNIPWSVASTKSITETSKLVPTAGGVWTHIDYGWTDPSGANVFKRDSVNLTPGQHADYIISY